MPHQYRILPDYRHSDTIGRMRQSKRKAKGDAAAPITHKLRALIAASGESIYAISGKTGIGYATLSDFAAGKSDIRLMNADKLAVYFGVTLSEG